MKDLGTVELQTQRLILRKATLDDAEAMFNNWASDYEVCKYLRWNPHKNIDETKNILNMWLNNYKNLDSYNWLICLKDNNIPIGNIAVVSKNELAKSAHIGYCISKKYWGQGIVSEAFAEVIEFLFLQVGYNRIESQHNTDNPASGKVMQKCGLKFEGCLKQSDWCISGICDVSVYAILKQEYLNNVRL